MSILELYNWAIKNNVEKEPLYLDYKCDDDYFNFSGEIEETDLIIDCNKPIIEIEY